LATWKPFNEHKMSISLSGKTANQSTRKNKSRPLEYWKGLRSIFCRTDLTMAAKALYCRLKVTYDQFPERCEVAHGTLAEDLGCNVSTVKRAIEDLVQVGLISCEGESGAPIRYNLEPRSTVNRSRAPKVVQNELPEVVQIERGRVAQNELGDSSECTTPQCKMSEGVVQNALQDNKNISREQENNSHRTAYSQQDSVETGLSAVEISEQNSPPAAEDPSTPDGVCPHCQGIPGQSMDPHTPGQPCPWCSMTPSAIALLKRTGAIPQSWQPGKGMPAA